jgi:hypothetical protein
VLGALTLIGMETYMAGLQDWVTVVQGFVFFIVVLSFRAGIAGTFAAAFAGAKRPAHKAENHSAALPIQAHQEH